MREEKRERDEESLSQAIKCATLNKLIERLTHEKYQNLNLRYVFLLTYRSFTSPQELLDKLIARYYIPIPPNLTPPELDMFKKNKIAPIQIKVFSVLKNWLEEHFHTDFAENNHSLVHQLLNHLEKIISDSTGPWAKSSAKALKALVKKKQSGGVRACVETPDPNSFPKTLIRPNIPAAQFIFIDADELELARQLTLMDFATFKQIQSREFLNKAWGEPNKEILAPNVCAMIDRFNMINSWVQLEILGQENISKRVAMLKKIIKIAEHCQSLNNFNSLCAIYTGINANAIYRLKKTWELLGEKHKQKLEEFKNLFKTDRNSAALRQVLTTALPPCIPHLGLFLGDLFFIEDGNLNNLMGMVNFFKRRMIAERIMWIRQYQQAAYQLRPIPVVQEYLSSCMRVVDQDTLWKMSTTVEPRQ
eukprot:TRINITY_DN2390_c0_g1_i2.p1 TRINITY_DN2390_c0_g1~~TRINITY_DN2390_c0_g1_i2.p1  ORF type:complete len:489 (+),score=135.39 TRINITY_DN2390_c0_g1_i2:211-1467(+)